MRGLRSIALGTFALLGIVGTGPALAEAPAGNEAAQLDAAPASVGWVAVPEPTPQAVAYHESGHWVWAVRQAWLLLVPAAWIGSGLAVRLRDASWRLGRRWPFALAIFVAGYLALSALAELPLTYYTSFLRPHQFGLSTEALGPWLIDGSKEMALGLALALPVLAIAYGLIAASPRRWWLWAGLLAAPALLGLALIKPVWIDPLFNEFGPMRDRALEARILSLARRAGIDADRVFEVDMSRKTRAVNAYVTGLLGTRRIVLWDTLLERLDDDEVLAVMGHEMGHYVLHHVLQGVLVASGLLLVGLGALHLAATRLLRRFGARLGVRGLGDFAALPWAVLLGRVVLLALAPVGYAYSRHIEHDADRFALELTRDNHAAARAFVALQRENLGYPRPGPLYTFLRSTHPSLGARIDFCNAYRPWDVGAPLRYAHLFREAVAARGAEIRPRRRRWPRRRRRCSNCP